MLQTKKVKKNKPSQQTSKVRGKPGSKSELHKDGKYWELFDKIQRANVLIILSDTWIVDTFKIRFKMHLAVKTLINAEK